MPETPITFNDVEVLSARGMTLRCRVGGKVVLVGRMQTMAGTTVSVEGDRGRLVIARSAAAELGLTTPDPPNRHARRVLIVEDNPAVRKATATLLETWGHTVETAADGESGLALAQSWSPDVVCLDLMLPRMNGAEIARRLTVALGDRRPVLLAVTAYGNTADRELADAAGFDGFLLKPVEATILEGIVGGALPLPPEVALPASVRLGAPRRS